jgi:glycosyltransferase involved in cell wall biosynthesis
MFAPMPPIKSISPYCSHLACELSKKVNLQIISFKRIPRILYAGHSPHDHNTRYKINKNFEVNHLISWNNPLSWIKASFKTKGNLVHIRHWIWYSSIAYCLILPMLKILDKKIIITVHNITPHVEKKYFVNFVLTLNKIIFNYCDFYLVHNKRNKKNLMRIYNIKNEKISIIKHGILKPYNIKNITKKNAMKILNIPEEKKILLFFGYIWQYKGLDILLESLVDIKDCIPNILLVIAGQPVESAEKWKRYEKKITKLKLNKFVIKRLEYIPDREIEIYFSAADIVVIPYKEPFDTQGGVPALSLFFKKPIIVTDIGGLPEYVKDKRAISKSNNSVELAKKIIFVLRNKTLIKKLSKDSEELSKILTWDKIVDKTIEIYKKVI